MPLLSLILYYLDRSLLNNKKNNNFRRSTPLNSHIKNSTYHSWNGYCMERRTKKGAGLIGQFRKADFSHFKASLCFLSQCIFVIAIYYSINLCIPWSTTNTSWDLNVLLAIATLSEVTWIVTRNRNRSCCPVLQAEKERRKERKGDALFLRRGTSEFISQSWVKNLLM